MSSAAFSKTGLDKKRLLFFLFIIFLGVPVLLFLLITAKGFLDQTLDSKPQEVVAVNISKSKAAINFVTSRKTQAVVEYGNSPNSIASYAPEIEPKKEHAVELTLLTPATVYYFQINIDGQIYDNDGVPWTFTTKTKDGTDVAAIVKGIATKKMEEQKEATKPAVLGTSNCHYSSCLEIQQNLGRGCSASDYFKCIALTQSESVNISSEIEMPTPTPTATAINSNSCRIKYLQVQPGEDCTEWTWEPFSTKSPECRNAFYQYVFQCSSKSFTSTNGEDEPTWYYNNAISNMDTNTITLNSKPANNSVVYCQVRAEDETGKATLWVQKEVTCVYPTP